MKIKPMSMLSAKEELALSDLDGTRKYLDEISYNIRGIFHGNHSEEIATEYKPVDIAEHLMNAMDVFTFAVEKLTDLDISKEELPKINSIISSLRNIIKNLEEKRVEIGQNISEEYNLLFLDKLEILTEVVDDAERIFFELRMDKNFMASVNRLFSLR
jgi:hypothetical protein